MLRVYFLVMPIAMVLMIAIILSILTIFPTATHNIHYTDYHKYYGSMALAGRAGCRGRDNSTFSGVKARTPIIITIGTAVRTPIIPTTCMIHSTNCTKCADCMEYMVLAGSGGRVG